MTMPFYSSVDQLLRDRSELARKGIARGRSVVVLTYTGGVLFVAENHSKALHKVSEIYDRIGFAAVGRYNEFENLRTGGIRLADVRGYSYDRRDVTGRWLANAYAQALGNSFTEQQKPYEVELCLAEVGAERRRRPALPHHLRRLDHRRAALRRHGRHHRADQRQAQGHLPSPAWSWRTPSRSPWRGCRRAARPHRRPRGGSRQRRRAAAGPRCRSAGGRGARPHPVRGARSAASPAPRCAGCSRRRTGAPRRRPTPAWRAATTPRPRAASSRDGDAAGS